MSFEPTSFCNFCLELVHNKCKSKKEANQCSMPKPKLHKTDKNDTSKTSKFST